MSEKLKKIVLIWMHPNFVETNRDYIKNCDVLLFFVNHFYLMKKFSMSYVFLLHSALNMYIASRDTVICESG